MFVFLAIVAVLCASSATVGTSLSFDESLDEDSNYKREFGFGVQRLAVSKRVQVDKGDVASQFDVSIAATSSIDPLCANVSTYYFSEAVIDNFAPVALQQHWHGLGQRYWVNDNLWGGPGYPIFVYIGGEWEESCRTLMPGHKYFYELAIEHQALMINVEHRFYGDSFPFKDTSTTNLQYLSALQGIADLARLLDSVIQDMNTVTSKVVTMGGSYAANLAAWFRLKYPHITHGSIASSAPLTAKENFFEYMEVVNDAMLFYAGESCPAAFRDAAEDVALLGAGQPGSSGFTQLEQLFATCEPMTSKKDLSILLSNLMGNIQGTVQYNKRRSTRMNVTDICEVMLNKTSETQTDLDRFVILAGKYRDMYNITCEDVSWEASIAFLANTTNNPRNNHRPWTFQTCNEFGYFQTTDSSNQPFTSWTQLNMSFYQDICYEAFDGWTDAPQIEWVNALYGGVNIAGTEIIFPAGSIDPWHALGIYDESAPLPDSSLQPLYISGTSHCHDLSVPWHTDIPELTAARSTIATTVKRWVMGDGDEVAASDDDDNVAMSTAEVFLIVLTVFFVAGSLVYLGIRQCGKGEAPYELTDEAL